MAPKTKEAIIAELKAKGIEFDENAKYNDLYKLLQSQPVKEPVLDIAGRSVPADMPPDGLPTELIERAKKIGFTKEQIAAYTDPKALEMACDRIKPQVNLPQPEIMWPKKRQIFRPFREKPKGEPAQAICISEISVLRAANVIRAGYDESNMGVFCRRHNPKILPENIQRVTVLRNYVPNKRDILTSTIIIDYLEKG